MLTAYSFVSPNRPAPRIAQMPPEQRGIQILPQDRKQQFGEQPRDSFSREGASRKSTQASTLGETLGRMVPPDVRTDINNFLARFAGYNIKAVKPVKDRPITSDEAVQADLASNPNQPARKKNWLG